MKPLCFVLMPFGKKAGPGSSLIDFDLVYNQIIVPAVTAADLDPLRADEETVGGIIHKPMFERLLLCPFAVADLTMANANVFYELGVRHAFRPWSTVPMMAENNRLPFDVQMLRTVLYKLTADGVPDPAGIEETRSALAHLLKEAKKGTKDSPIFQLLEGVEAPTIAHEKTDTFREEVEYSNKVKASLAQARRQGAEAVAQVEQELGDISGCESGVVVDLLLSYRATKQFQAMVDLVGKMAPPLADTVLVREQMGFALNRMGRGEEAEAVLTKIIEERGASSETLGLLGRVYKDRWEQAVKAEDDVMAAGLLKKAIDAYLRGFEADWRDAYPGINAVTLMEIKNPPDERSKELIPVVKYSVLRKMARGKPDYWDYATLLELAILGMDEQNAREMLAQAAACIREKWEPETTARNLRIIREAREQRAAAPAWAKQIEDNLVKRSA